jgi:inosine-uridine nucleoside N-ribohydrolase
MPGTNRPSIILDCDPGHDDAVALLVAGRHTDLVGVTTVAGNAPLSATTRNALIMLDLIGKGDVPMHAGADRPLVVPPRHAGYVHGESGIDGTDLPEPSRPADSADAVGFIIDTCRATEGIWLVPTGPLTNIALALRAAPDLARRIAGVSLMGGGRFGNRTAAAEFNIWADPHAAAMVFDYGGPLKMCGLHLSHTFQATPPRIEALRAAGGRLSNVLAELMVFFSGTYIERSDNLTGAPVHDPLAVLVLTHPELFTSIEAHVVVETMGEHTIGQTLIDSRGLVERLPPNCTVYETVDADAGFDVIIAAAAALAG